MQNLYGVKEYLLLIVKLPTVKSRVFAFLKDDTVQIKEPEEPLLSPTTSWSNKRRFTATSNTTGGDASKEFSQTDDDDDSETENTHDLLSIYDNQPVVFIEPEHLSDNEISSVKNSVKDCEIVEWKPEELVKKFIQLFVDEGDVQMAVHIALTVQNVLDITSLPLEQYFDAYIEQLRQLQLHTEATKILHLSRIESIQQTQDNTFQSLSCENCTNQILIPSKRRGRCQSCLKMVFQCSICRIRVDGPYIWCSWCCHGGHLECMDGNFVNRLVFIE